MIPPKGNVEQMVPQVEKLEMVSFYSQDSLQEREDHQRIAALLNYLFLFNTGKIDSFWDVGYMNDSYEWELVI